MRKLMILPLLFIILVNAETLLGKNRINQPGKITGTIKDEKTLSALAYATITVQNQRDSSVIIGGTSDINGNFKIESIPFGNYFIKITLLGYVTYKTPGFSLSINQSTKDFGNLNLKVSSNLLNEVTIQEKQILVEQKGDTVQYHADAFKTHPDATAEDLVTKMPGVTSDNNGVKVNGEDIKQVLVDGKPFFGDDPGMALKNLPAEVIDKIQVFDKASDQAQFTGFDDGQSNKTMNILTKKGKANGEFGKAYAGYGTDDHYIAGGNLNIFDGDRRISILGLSNNINQQNFTTQDLLGVVGGSGGQGRGSGGSRGGSAQGSSSAMSNFLIPQQGGISSTQAIGFNYSDKWGKDIKVTSSYFYNSSDNVTGTVLTRNYYTPHDSGLVYNEKNESENVNNNHRFNLRLEYSMDSSNSFIFTPKLNIQNNHANSTVAGNNIRSENFLESSTNNDNTSINSGYNFSNNALYRHKFKKAGRTISLNVGTTVNDKLGTSTLNSRNNYYELNDSTLINQQSKLNSNGYTVSTSLNYTEPIDSNSQLQLNYSPSYSGSKNDNEMWNFNGSDNGYTHLDTALSNKYTSTYLTNRAGLAYRRHSKKYNFSSGLNFQYATLSGNQYFPATTTLEKNFNNILPQALFNYRFEKGTNLRIIYQTSTNAPSISQLQNVLNNSNPLLLSIGNPDLKQEYEHTLISRYGKTGSKKSTGLFLFFYVDVKQDYIGSSTLIPDKSTTLSDGIVLNRGSQLSKPINLQGYWNTRTSATYSMPITKIKCNLNLTTALGFSQTPALINDQTNWGTNYNGSQTVGLSSNISELVDFNISSTSTYNIVKNTLQTQSNSNYFTQTASIKFNWIFFKGWVFNTNVNQTLYSGLAQNLNQNFLLWNLSLGYKLLKNKALEVKVGVFDLLNQNKSITRTITDTYIEDSETKVLNRYFMLTLTYNLKKFKA